MRKVQNEQVLVNALAELGPDKKALLYEEVLKARDPNVEKIKASLKEKSLDALIEWIVRWAINDEDLAYIRELAEEEESRKSKLSRQHRSNANFPVLETAAVIGLFLLAILAGMLFLNKDFQTRVAGILAQPAETTAQAPFVTKGQTSQTVATPVIPQVPQQSNDQCANLPDGVHCFSPRGSILYILANLFEVKSEFAGQRNTIVEEYATTLANLGPNPNATEMIKGAMEKDPRLQKKGGSAPTAPLPVYQEPPKVQASDPACNEVREELKLRGITGNLESLVAEICPKYQTIRDPNNIPRSKTLLQAFLNSDSRFPKREFAAPPALPAATQIAGVTLPTSIPPTTLAAPIQLPTTKTAQNQAVSSSSGKSACFKAFTKSQMLIEMILPSGLRFDREVSRYDKNDSVAKEIGSIRWRDPFFTDEGGWYEEGLSKCTPPPPLLYSCYFLLNDKAATFVRFDGSSEGVDLTQYRGVDGFYWNNTTYKLEPDWNNTRVCPSQANPTNPPQTSVPTQVVVAPTAKPTQPANVKVAPPLPTAKPTIAPPTPRPSPSATRWIPPATVATYKHTRDEILNMVRGSEICRGFEVLCTDSEIQKWNGNLDSAYDSMKSAVDLFNMQVANARATAAAASPTPTKNPSLDAYCLQYYRPWAFQASVRYLPENRLLPGYEALNRKDMEPLPKGGWTFKPIKSYLGMMDQWAPTSIQKCSGYEEWLDQ